MDSMRSLNNSLPASTPLSTKPQSPEQLLQAFKSAALSVTNLYKSAAASQSDARQQGYQDALEDLLVFLDKGNLGLMDGEGWKVRQWATERYTRGPAVGLGASDDEDDNGDEESRTRSSSPVRQQNNNLQPPSRTISPVRKEASPAPPIRSSTSPPQQQDITPPNPTMFTFTAAPPLSVSLDADMSTSDVAADNVVEHHGGNATATAPMRLEVHSRSSRTSQRHSGNSHNGHRSGTREVRFNAGTKRKFQVPDFFNLSNLDNSEGKDNSGGGSKRGRFV